MLCPLVCSGWQFWLSSQARTASSWHAAAVSSQILAFRTRHRQVFFLPRCSDTCAHQDRAVAPSGHSYKTWPQIPFGLAQFQNTPIFSELFKRHVRTQQGASILQAAVHWRTPLGFHTESCKRYRGGRFVLPCDCLTSTAGRST